MFTELSLMDIVVGRYLSSDHGVKFGFRILK